MGDRFKAVKLMNLLWHVVQTTGLSLINIPMDYCYSMGVDTTIIDEKINLLRSLINDMEEIITDSLSLQYLYYLYIRTGDRETWKNYFYANDAKYLCLLPVSVRESAYRIYLDNHLDFKYLELLANNSYPTVLNIEINERIVVPFFPTVTKLFLMGGKYHDITAYLGTLVELTTSIYDVRYYQFMIEAKSLQYISMGATFVTPGNNPIVTVNMINIRKVLERRRNTTNLPMLGFKFIFTWHIEDANMKIYTDLLAELSKHDLRVLSIPMYDIDAFDNMIASLPNLVTLSVFCKFTEVFSILHTLKDRIPKLERLRIDVDDAPITPNYLSIVGSMDDLLFELVTSRPNLKELAIKGIYDDEREDGEENVDLLPSDKVKLLIEHNILRDKKLGDSDMLKKIRSLVLPIDARVNFFGIDGSLLTCEDVVPTITDDTNIEDNVPTVNDIYKTLYSKGEIKYVGKLQELARMQKNGRIDIPSEIEIKSVLMEFDPDTKY